MDIEALKTFLAVEEQNNFTKAAEKLYCTQAAISMRIKKLEHILDCQLFIRHGKQVELSSEGKIFLPYAKQIVNTWHSSREHLLQSRLMEQSEIQITSSSTPGSYIIPSVMYLFRQKYPYITVLNHVQYTKNAIADVISGKYPLGIVSQPFLSNNGNLICEPLMDDPLVLVVKPNHPWVANRGIFLHQLREETLLVSNPNTSLVKYLESAGNFNIDPDHLYVAGNIEAIKRGVLSGQGVSVMSAYAVHQEIELGLLKQVPIFDNISLFRKLYTIKRTDVEWKLSTTLFIEFLRKMAEEEHLFVSV